MLSLCRRAWGHSRLMPRDGAVSAPALWNQRSINQNVSDKAKDKLKQSYAALGLKEDCDASEINKAYIGLAKKYHPDSGSPDADPLKFVTVKQAYNSILVGLL